MNLKYSYMDFFNLYTNLEKLIYRFFKAMISNMNYKKLF